MVFPFVHPAKPFHRLVYIQRIFFGKHSIKTHRFIRQRNDFYFITLITFCQFILECISIGTEESINATCDNFFEF